MPKGKRASGPVSKARPRASGPASKQDAAAARKAALIRYARAHIARHGLQKASLNEILRRAGGSKATLVKYFGNKAGLFSVALTEDLYEIMARMTWKAHRDQDMTADIRALIIGLLDFYLRPECIEFYRSVIATANTRESLAETFYQSGHAGIVASVSQYLARWKGCGIRADLDFDAEAGRLTHMIRSDLYERALLGLVKLPLPRDAIERFATAATHLFLSGVAEAATTPKRANRD